MSTICFLVASWFSFIFFPNNFTKIEFDLFDRELYERPNEQIQMKIEKRKFQNKSTRALNNYHERFDFN